MPHYRLMSPRGEIIAECDGINAGSALSLASRCTATSGDVYQDGSYLFSLERGQEGAWIIHSRKEQHDAPRPPARPWRRRTA